MDHTAIGATITKFTIRAIKAPLEKPHKTASGTIEVAPLVTLEIDTSVGVRGSSYVFVYTPLALQPVANLLKEIEVLAKGHALAPTILTKTLESKFRLLGIQGLTGIAIAAIDMAAWDAVAKIQAMPLAQLLGGAITPIRVYDSLGQMGPNETADEVEASFSKGFNAVKIKAAHADASADVEVLSAIRNVAGRSAWVAADFNQAFSVSESIWRIRQLEEIGLDWIEEPVRAEDYVGHAAVKSKVKVAVQTGENWWGIPDMTKAIAAGASDLVMLDVMKIGGVTGWMRAAALAAAHGFPVSSHLFTEISAHLLSVTPTAHMLEWLDISSAINSTPLIIRNGMAVGLDEPGCGVNFDQKALEKYAA